MPDAKGPDAVILRLHLRGLENLRIDNGQIEIIASILSHSGNRILQRIRNVSDGTGKAKELQAADPRRLAIKIVDRAPKPTGKIPIQDGYVEIMLPAVLLAKPGSTLHLNWIDFYR